MEKTGMGNTGKPLNQNKQASGDTQVARAAGVVGFATLLSRIFGYARDLVVASLFGAGMASDTFFIAFSIPNLLRRLFAEGSLSIAFVPVFSRYLNRDGFIEASRLANSAIRLLALVLVPVCGVCVLLAPWIVHLLAYGWTDFPEKMTLCVQLTRIMFPYLVFISLVALCMGILNVLKHFAAPALSPILLNIAMIGAIVTGSYFTTSEAALIQWLAWGVLIGGLLQLLVQLPFLVKKGVCLWRPAKLWHPGIKQVLILMGPAVFGAAVYQINSLILRLLASQLPQGSVSYLYYADRLIQFPLGIFGIAAATAVLPALSHHAAQEQWQALRETFGFAMRLVLFITLPSMVGLIVLREPIVTLLFQRGAFDLQAMRLTASALLYYGVGLWAFSAVRIVLSTFYALQDTWTPVWIGILSIAFNTLLSVVFMKTMQHAGLALALSLSSVVNLGLLIIALRKRMGALGWRKIAASAAASLLCSAVMGCVVWGLAQAVLPMPESGAQLQLLAGLVLCVVIGSILYISLAYIFKVPELQTLFQIFIRKTDVK